MAKTFRYTSNFSQHFKTFLMLFTLFRIQFHSISMPNGRFIHLFVFELKFNNFTKLFNIFFSLHFILISLRAHTLGHTDDGSAECRRNRYINHRIINNFCEWNFAVFLTQFLLKFIIFFIYFCCRFILTNG